MSVVRIAQARHRVLPVNFHNQHHRQYDFTTAFGRREDDERELSVASADSSMDNSDVMSEEASTDEYHYMESSHSVQLLTGLNCLRQEGLLCDVTICVDGQEFLCHRTVMASFSPYFKAMFTGNLAESRQDKVSINGVDPSTVGQLIDYAYTSEVHITSQNVQFLLSAANLLEVLPVKEACCNFLERNTDETNCLGILCFVEAHACTELQEKTKEYVLNSFQNVSTNDEFLNIPSSKLVELISDDNLCVDNEEFVFDAVFKWLNHNLKEREADLYKVLQHVRLAQLSPYFLHDCVEQNKLIMNSTECRSLVVEAKTYQLLEDRRNELRSPRTRPRNFTGNKEVIVAVGGEDDKVVLRSVECYDLQGNQWKSLTCLPFAISKHGLAVSGGSIYLAGGEYPDGLASKNVWRYDTVFDVWQEAAPMNISRSELGIAVLDGYVYAVGGWEGTSRLDSIERYNPASNTWTFVAPMKMSLTSPAVVACDGLLYVTGGAVLEDGDGIDMVQCYNPKTNSWSEKARMLIPRSGSVACVLNGCIYVVGGWHASTENTNKVECYNPKTDVWQWKSSMMERRYRPGIAVVDGKIYVCGGEEGWDRYHDTIECYDEENDEWFTYGDMRTSRSWLGCVTVTMNKSLLVGDRASNCDCDDM